MTALLLQLRKSEAWKSLVARPGSRSQNLMCTEFECRPPPPNLHPQLECDTASLACRPAGKSGCEITSSSSFGDLRTRRSQGSLGRKESVGAAGAWVPSSPGWCLGTPALGSERPVFAALLQHTCTSPSTRSLGHSFHV